MPGLEEKESRWAALKQRSSGLVDRVAGSVKDVARSSLLKQGQEARERGNVPAAYWLLDEAFREREDDKEVCSAFWDVACDYGRPGEAIRAVVHLVERHASEGQLELASQYWTELVAFDPGAPASPAALTRIFPTLHQQIAALEAQPEIEEKTNALLAALHVIVDPSNEGLTPTIAFRVTELARELDTDITVTAALFCLQTKDLHEVKRKHLVDLIRALAPERVGDIPEPDYSLIEADLLEAEPMNEDLETDLPEADLLDPDLSESELLDPELPPIDCDPELTAGTPECPARNHPLKTASPQYRPLHPEEVARAKLPPTRPLPTSPSPFPIGAESIEVIPVKRESIEDELLLEGEPIVEAMLEGEPVEDTILEAELVSDLEPPAAEGEREGAGEDEGEEAYLEATIIEG